MWFHAPCKTWHGDVPPWLRIWQYGQIDEQKRLDRKPPWVNLGEFNICEGTCMLGKSFKVWGMGAL